MHFNFLNTLQIVKWLVEAGANVNAEDEDDNGTPLFNALEVGANDIVN